MVRILLVDDDDALRAVLRRALERAGYMVFEAFDGRAALRVIAEGPVALVITDLVMPDMEGLELIRSLRCSHPTLPVIVISGGTRPGMEDYLPVAKLLGVASILTKPFELPQFIDAVRTLVG